MEAVKTLDRAYKVDEVINSGKLLMIRFEAEDKKVDAENKENRRKEVTDWLKKEVPNRDDVAAYAVATKDVPELVARYKLYADITLIFFCSSEQVKRLNLNTGTKLEKYNGTIGQLVEKNKTKNNVQPKTNVQRSGHHRQG